MSINVNDKNLGHATAYAYYKAGGGTMTEAEFTEFMADFGTASQTAVEAAQAALASKNAAQTAATTATNKASEATTAATTATNKAGEASTSASTATSAKDTAVSASQTATTKATEATTAAATATSAKTDAVAANTAAQSAKTAAQTAQTGAETAAASVEASAEQIATNAEDISQLKSEFNQKADLDELYKAFPTDTASGAVASFADGANVPVKSLVVNIDPVQSGSGDPSHDNVRPISGWNEVNVNACGINMWDEEWEIGAISDTTGENTTNNIRIRSVNYIPVIPNAQYYPKKGDSPSTVFVFWYNAEKTYLRYESQSWSYIVKTIPSDAYYMRFMYIGTTYDHDISINYPSTDHDYHPYSGQSINIALGRTVYGGKLDVVSGKLVIDRSMVDMGTLTWDTYNNFMYAVVDNIYTDPSASTSVIIDLLCAQYKAISYSDVYSNRQTGISGYMATPRVAVYDPAYTDPYAFKSAMSGVMLCYPLATPLTISLTPHEVIALLGSNNIWADTGDSKVEYRADPTLYIQRLTEPDADMIADANIVSGQYFMVGNTLYKATANIASGGAITPNVNCTRKSLSEALNELNA